MKHQHLSSRKNLGKFQVAIFKFVSDIFISILNIQ